jgi:RNA polymerase sigma-70 factor (ECF subfamily)
MSGMDRKLIEQISNKDAEKTFEYLFHMYYPSLCAYASAIIRNNEDAKDLVNDFFYEFWKKRQVIEIKSSLKSYLYISIRNSAINYIKKKQREQKYVSSQAYPLYLQEEISSEVEKLIQIENFEERLKKAIDLLPQQCRNIFYLNRFEQLGYKEIASKLNLSVGTVKTQIARALKKLRIDLEGIEINSQIFFFILVRHFNHSLSYR